MSEQGLSYNTHPPLLFPNNGHVLKGCPLLKVILYGSVYTEVCPLSERPSTVFLIARGCAYYEHNFNSGHGERGAPLMFVCGGVGP